MIPEAAERGTQLDAMFRECACGDENAVHVCWAVFRFLHMLDDLVDRDVDVPADTVGLTLISFVEAVAANPFFQANRTELLTCLRVGILEWMESEAWKRRGDLKSALAAEVLKSSYQNFFYLVASLCGGLVHMRGMSAKYRDYQWDLSPTNA